MKLLLGSLLLTFLCACFSWCVSSGTLVVTQSPDVSPMEGETVNITCCWTLTSERMRVDWLKNQTNTNKSEIFSLINQSQGSMPKETSNCSHLTFTNVTREDSGRYICRVTTEIPFLTVVKGTGTVITVIANNNNDYNNTDTKEDTAGGSHGEEVFIYVLRCLPILILIITFFCIHKFVTKAQLHTSGARGNKLTAAQRPEENQEEEERDERETEAV